MRPIVVPAIRLQNGIVGRKGRDFGGRFFFRFFFMGKGKGG